MSNRLMPIVVAAAFLLVVSALGVYVIPNFGPIFSDMFPNRPLPWITRIVLLIGPVGFIGLAVFGAVSLVITGSMPRTRWLHTTIVVALALILAITVVALYVPLLKLLETTA